MKTHWLRRTACAFAGVLATMTVMTTMTGHALAAPARATSPAATSAGTRSAWQAAALKARATKKDVPISGATTQTTTVTALPDGKFSMTTSVLPVRVKQQGTWVPVSATLHRNSDGTYSPQATPSGLTLSGGGTAPLVTLTSADGRRLALSFPVRLPAPAVSGATATYGNVLPGVNLQVTASDQGGFSEDLIIENAAAAANPRLRDLRLATTTKGLSLHTDKAGNLTVTGPDGKPEFTGPAPRMWSAGTAPAARQHATMKADSEAGGTGPAAGAQEAAVGLRAASGSLTLVPDRKLLDDKSARFPLVLDPSVSPTSSGTAGYDETQQGCSTTENWDAGFSDGNGIGYQNYPDTSCQGLYVTFYQMNTTNLNSSMDVTSATLYTQEIFGSDLDCSDTWPASLEWVTGIGPSTSWSNPPSQISVLGTQYPQSANCGVQDVNYDVTSVMQTTAENNYTQWTFGLYGDESNLPDSSCSPSSEYNCGFMRFANNPSITTVFDITPNVPSNTVTTPDTHVGTTAIGCGPVGSTYGWVGATDLGANSGNQLTLNATVTSNITGEQVAAHYMIWNNMEPGYNVVATPTSPYVASGTTVDQPVGITLQNGDQYGWRVSATDGNLTSAYAPDCHFNVDTTPPTVPAVTSPAFPPSGTSSTAETGTTGTFSFASTDPVPSCSGCLASGVAYYEYSFGSPIPASGAATVAAGATVSYTAKLWGTNVLYVAAVDNAGNVSQTAQYDFFVKWNPKATVTAGDIDGDGISDLLETNTAGNLLVYPGGSDPSIAPEVASTPAASPDGTSWDTYQVTHRGSMAQEGVDDLFAHKGANLYLYLNNQNDPGAAPQFGNTADIVPVLKRPCTATASNPANCATYDASDWSQATQVLAPGDVYGTGRPDLLTVENGQLWLYKGEPGDFVDSPVLLGSSGWNDVTVIAPGDVGGVMTLWARDNSTGTIYSWPLTLDSNGVPELGTASVGAPVTATSGTVVSGVTLPAATYPSAISSGALTGGTCASGDSTPCPGIYVTDMQGNLWYFEGQPTAGGASPLSGAKVLVGSIDNPAADWPLTSGSASGSTVTDVTGDGNNATLNGGASWATDSARGSVLSLDGSSGYLQLPNDFVYSKTSLSFSLWFKTTAAGGTLLSSGQAQIGDSSPDDVNAMPMLYVGTDGLLYGQLSTGSVDQMASTTAVDDGKWHHAVITGNGDTQSLYLDGQLIGSVSGTLANLDPYDFIGAGYVNADGWANAPATGWSYFNGEISDAEYYTYQLSPDAVSALYNGQDGITQFG